MKRDEILDEAKRIVTGHRNEEYGGAENNFSRIANLWTAYIGHSINAIDVAAMMSLVKLARIKAGGTDDCFVDLAGYAACGGEIYAERKDRLNDKRSYVSGECKAVYHTD